jgi:riboflavin kinase/FMN adenylyltransferase
MDDVFHGSDQYPTLHEGPVVTIGNFDGVHLGHRALLDHTLALSASLNRMSCAFTFSPAPRDVLRPENPVLRLQRTEDRIASLLSAGLDQVVVEPFDLAYAKKDAKWFAEEVLTRRLNASAVVVGWDFRFGRGRTGGFEELASWMKVPVEQVEVHKEGGEVLSSSRIRFALHDGKVEEVCGYLGRPHEVVGTVVAGDGRGKQLGYPTANIATETPLVPGDGVYAVRVYGLAEEALEGVCNIGSRPTFGKGPRQVEVHVLDAMGDFYGSKIRLCFLRRLRGEQTFDSSEALVAQICVDIEAARTCLRADLS